MRSTLTCLALIGLCSGCGLPGSGPAYSIDQTDSAHAGYRRTTITSAGAVFVHAFEEYIEFHGADQSIRASWIPASASFTLWSTTGD